MTDKTAAERMRAYRVRKRKDGLIEVKVWAHPEDAAAIRAYARKKMMARKP